MKSNRSPRKLSNNSKSPIKSKGVYFDLKTLKRYDLPGEGREYFDSQLELSAFLKLAQVCPYEIARQHPITLVPQPHLEVWKADFFIPETRTVIEVKGGWLSNKNQKAARHLFRLQMNLVLSRGYELILLGDRDETIQKLDTPIINYRGLHGGYFSTP